MKKKRFVRSDIGREMGKLHSDFCDEALGQSISRDITNFIAQSISEKKRVEIRNFGSFALKRYDAVIRRNPKTGDKVYKGVRYGCRFRQSKHIKDVLNER